MLHARTKITFRVIVVALVTGCAIVFIGSYLYRSSTGLYIVVSDNNSGEKMKPLAYIDTGTRKVSTLQLPAIGCNGIAGQRSEQVNVYCISSQDKNNLYEVNFKEGTYKVKALLPKPFEKVSAPARSIALQYGEVTVYADGGPGVMFPDGSVSDAGVVFSSKDHTQKVFISERSYPLFILKMVFDEVSKKLWILSHGDGEHLVIDRIDLDTRVIDFSTTTASYSSFDLDVTDTDMWYTLYRGKDQNDIVILDKVTGERRKQITLPTTSDQGYNALALLRTEKGMLVSSLGGIFVLDPTTYAVKEFIPNNPGSQFTAFTERGRYIYAIDTYERVVEIRKANLMKTKVLYEVPMASLTGMYLINK
jgi:hypothetical protein